MKVLVIVTHAVAKATHQALCDALARCFAPPGHRVEIHQAGEKEDIPDYVRGRLPEGFEVVVAVGGDGTVAAVSDGLVGGAVPLAIVPAGTGNLFAREFDIPRGIAEAVALLAGAPRRKTVDVMRIGRRIYVLNASVGISASTVSGTTRVGKHLFGRIAYVAVAILKVLTTRPRHLSVTVDGVEQAYRMVEITVLNCSLLNRLLYPKGPVVRVDDGRLGVWIVGWRSLLDYPRYFFSVWAGWPLNLPVQFIDAERRVTITSSTPLPVQADGDIIGSTPVHIDVLPSALTVFVP